MKIMAASRRPANEPSRRWRTSLPRLGSVRKWTGAVPGRRPTKRPPLSVGSVRIGSYVRSYCSVARSHPPTGRQPTRAGAAPVRLSGVQSVEHVGVFLVDHVALDL